jgi:hypothetical protein
VLGNSGKPVTLGTLSLTKFLRCVFRNREFTIFGSLEPAKLQIREYVKFAGHDSKKTWVANARKPGISNRRRRELRRAADSGICRGLRSRVMHGDIHEPEEKQRLIRESVRDPVRESRVKIFTNR